MKCRKMKKKKINVVVNRLKPKFKDIDISNNMNLEKYVIIILIQKEDRMIALLTLLNIFQ